MWKNKFLIYLSALFCSVLFTGQNAFSQQRHDTVKPQWMRKLPTPSNNTYHFQAFRIDGASVYSAMKQLPDVAAFYMERQYNIKGVTVETFELRDEYSNGKNKHFELQQIHDTVYTETGEVNVRLAIVDEYVSDDGVYFLCTIPDPNCRTVAYDNFELTTQYGARGLWRSAIVPGWGQFHKGSYLKGGLILGGTAALIGGVVATDSIKTDYARRIGETHNVDYKRLYAKRVDQFSTVRNICIGALGALYVYNLIDAIAAPGARRVIVKEKGSSGGRYASYSFYPTSPDGMSVAMAFNLTF